MDKNYQLNNFKKALPRSKRSFASGFTFIELLFVLAIAAAVLTIVVLVFSRLNSNKVLEKGADLVVSVLNEARSLTLSAKNDSQYGVKLEDSRVTLFRGSNYSAVDPNNVVTPLNSLTGIQDLSISGGGDEIVFKRLTGETDQTGTLEVYLKSNPADFYTITIEGTGNIEIE